LEYFLLRIGVWEAFAGGGRPSYCHLLRYRLPWVRSLAEAGVATKPADFVGGRRG
jgi:hypothetical protein